MPILVRRDPSDADRYLLVYGRRRLEAIRHSNKVSKVRALVASMDDDSAVRAQITENMARRDLTFIERAIFARELIESGFGNQSQVAEVLTVTKSSVSMAMAILDAVGVDLARAIGPAPNIGRPRWDDLGRALAETDVDPAQLIAVAERVHTDASIAVIDGRGSDPQETSTAAFEAVMKALPAAPAPARAAAKPARKKPRALTLDGQKTGSIRRTAKGVQIDLAEGAFADWVEAEAQDLIADLHARWLQRSEDQ